MTEEMNGCSIRRYTLKVSLIKESDHHIETDDGDGSKDSISDNEVVQVLDEGDGGIYSTNIIESLLHPPPVIVLGNLGEQNIALSFEQLDMKGISVLECRKLSTIVVWKRRQNQIDTNSLTHCKILLSQCVT
jgi:hypothetical protein